MRFGRLDREGGDTYVRRCSLSSKTLKISDIVLYGGNIRFVVFLDTEQQEEGLFQQDHHYPMSTTEGNVRWTGDECFLYRIPPRTSGSRGYRADAWNLGQPTLTCTIRVIEAGDKCLIKLFDIKSGKLAACSEIFIQENGERSKLDFFMEPVVDSSRYYVLRVGDKRTKRVIYLGIGFRTRPDASCFREAIQDYARFRRRDFEAKRLQEAFDKSAASTDDASGEVVVDETLSIKDDQVISIPGVKKSTNNATTNAKEEVEDDSFFLLDSPDKRPKRRAKKSTVEADGPEKEEASGAAANGGDDDWGDFTTAE